MKKYLIISLLLSAMTAMAACTPSDPDTGDGQTATPGRPGDIENPDTTGRPDQPSQSKTLVAYFPAQEHTQAVAGRIAEILGTDIFRIQPAEPYAENPYDDSDRIQDEAYNGLRPAVASLPEPTAIAAYDTLFVGSPIWWHQPAMVVCTFLENYDLSGKIVIPFFTYGSTEYLQHSIDKVHDLTPSSIHLRTYTGGSVDSWLHAIHILQ